MTATLLEVPWPDARAEALRDAMNLETGAMYRQFVAGRSPEERSAMDSALAVDPDTISYTVIALDGDEPVGHAALRPEVSTGSTRLEVKKVFVAPGARGRGISRVLMAHLEDVARERGIRTLVLQTGVLQVPAIALYESMGYVVIPPFGAYTAIPGALCYEKAL